MELLLCVYMKIKVRNIFLHAQYVSTKNKDVHSPPRTTPLLKRSQCQNSALKNSGDDQR